MLGDPTYCAERSIAEMREASEKDDGSYWDQFAERIKDEVLSLQHGKQAAADRAIMCAAFPFSLGTATLCTRSLLSESMPGHLAVVSLSLKSYPSAIQSMRGEMTMSESYTCGGLGPCALASTSRTAQTAIAKLSARVMTTTGGQHNSASSDIALLCALRSP